MWRKTTLSRVRQSWATAQVLRSGTSVGAHVREGKRSRSDAEMVSKTEGALQELEETTYWLHLLADSGIVKAELLVLKRSEGRRVRHGLTQRAEGILRFLRMLE